MNNYQKSPHFRVFSLVYITLGALAGHYATTAANSTPAPQTINKFFHHMTNTQSSPSHNLEQGTFTFYFAQPPIFESRDSTIENSTQKPDVAHGNHHYASKLIVTFPNTHLDEHELSKRAVESTKQQEPYHYTLSKKRNNIIFTLMYNPDITSYTIDHFTKFDKSSGLSIRLYNQRLLNDYALGSHKPLVKTAYTKKKSLLLS